MSSDKVITFDSQNFQEEVLESDLPVIVDFWAQWCSPCLVVGPIIEELAEYFEGRVKVGKLNIDNDSEISAKYRVMSIPTIMMFKEGEMVDKRVGAHTKDDFIGFIESNL